MIARAAPGIVIGDTFVHRKICSDNRGTFVRINESVNAREIALNKYVTLGPASRGN